MEANTPQDPFKEIRPYHDSEVEAVLQRLLYDNELISAVTHYQLPSLPAWLGKFLKPFVRIGLAREFDDIQSVKQFQRAVAKYMAKMISRSTTRLTCSGIEKLEKDEAYLFISNHRDIAMDPAFVNWAHYQCELPTVRVAIGDNLLSKPYVSDLMRLNKSFIVKRSSKGPRETLATVTLLSAYIDASIQQGESVWIAQREGRAKNGNDTTDPAILKMLYMSQRKQRNFAQAIKRLNIVPISISYEFDPCDRAKAIELASREKTGEYKKSENEDIESIVQGITGFKGAVHVNFGDVIINDYNDPEVLAAELDRQIHQGYFLHPSNYLGADQFDKATEQERDIFEERFQGLTQRESEIMRQMYANPVYNQELKKGDDVE